MAGTSIDLNLVKPAITPQSHQAHHILLPHALLKAPLSHPNLYAALQPRYAA
jgi:hypothetical protein